MPGKCITRGLTVPPVSDSYSHSMRHAGTLYPKQTHISDDSTHILHTALDEALSSMVKARTQANVGA